jgi:Mg-chelatase subunit ChlD
MKTTTFQATAVKVANVIGRKSGLSITFGGTQAASAPGHIHLPALPAGTTMTPHQVDVFRGFLNHEVGHQRYSDQYHWLDIFPIDPDTKEPKHDVLERHVTNWIEDVRTDKAESEEYPGALQDLEQFHRFACKRDQEMVEAIPDYHATAARVGLGLMFEEIFKHAHGPLAGIRKGGVRGLEFKDLGKQFELVQEAINEGVPQLTSTQDTHALAKKILKLLEDAVQNYDPNEAGDPADQDGEGRPGEGQPGDGQPGDGESGQPDQSGQSGQGGNTAKPQQAGDLRQDPVLPGDGRGLLEKLLKDIMGGKNAPGKKGQKSDPNPHQTPIEGEVDDYLVPAGYHLDQIFKPAGSAMDRYRRERAAVAAVTSQSKKMVTQFLRSRELKAWTRGLEDGTFDDEAAAEVLLRERRVFMERRFRTLQNTAIVLMVDLSSSMNEYLVRQAAIVLSEALASFQKIKVLAAGFRTNDAHYDLDETAGRHVGIDVLLFKDFEEHHQKAIARYGAVETDGCTPLGEGYAFAYEALVPRPEKRKVLWLVTDGAPYYEMGRYHYSHHGSASNDWILMDWIHRKARKDGVETYALGVGHFSESRRLKKLVDGYGEIHSIEQLPGALLRMAKKAIRVG